MTVDQRDVVAFCEYFKTIPISAPMTAEGFGYDNAVEICLDAVLSINRQYYRFVVPRLKFFKSHYPAVRTLDQLQQLLDLHGTSEFCHVWNYRHEGRAVTLQALVNKFRQIAEKPSADLELKMLKDWAHAVSARDSKSFGVQGIGLATFQYLRMMLGVATVKPDIHIMRACETALKRRVGQFDSIDLVEKASQTMGLSPTFVDHNLWRFHATDSATLGAAFQTS